MAVCALASPASAHGFGQRYDLPLPLYLYLYGTAAVVVVTFVLVAFFARRTGGTGHRPRLDLLAYAPGKIIAHPGVILLLKLFAAGLFVVTVAAGFIGDQNPYRNIAPTMVWIIVWVGVAYVSAFVGDLWALINPWATIFNAAAWLYRRVGSGRVLLWASSFDIDWNDLVLRPVFLPFVHQMARHLAAYREPEPWLTVGESAKAAAK